MGTSRRLAPYYDMRSQNQEILSAAKAGPCNPSPTGSWRYASSL